MSRLGKVAVLFAVLGGIFWSVPADAWHMCVEYYTESGCNYYTECNYYDNGSNWTGRVRVFYECF